MFSRVSLDRLNFGNDLIKSRSHELVHHLDDPKNKGVAGLNIEGVFSYCHHFFQENADALFGIIPNPDGLFPEVKCKKCSTSS